jgi:hypothetical protein
MRLALALMLCGGLGGCAVGPRQFRQSMGPGPGPGCSNTMDCQCKNGVAAACEQLATMKPPKPRPQKPPPLPPPGTGEALEKTEKEKVRDSCSDDYVRCIGAGGEFRPGRVKGETLCESCRAYCTANSFWPDAIYSWTGKSERCLGK